MTPFAVFDIGSNTLLMTVGAAEAGSLNILSDQGDVVRLGEGLVDGGNLQAAAKARVLASLKQFKHQAEQMGVRDFLAAGTAAFRRASDGAEFAQEIENTTGIPVKILSGEEEAKYSYRSAAADFEKTYGPIGMIDIGGGSTEIVYSYESPFFSLPLGTVRLSEELKLQHPIDDAAWAKLRRNISEILYRNLPLQNIPKRHWVAVAATPASLAAVLLQSPHYDPNKIQGFTLGKIALESLIETLRTRSIAERQQMPGMHPKRAELLPIGGAILAEAMRTLGLNDITVSDHGLRYGILIEQYP